MSPRRAPQPSPKPEISSEEKALCAHSALIDRRAVEPVLLDMRELTLITDYFLICHGTSNVHIRGLADAVVEALQQKNLRSYSVEGHRDARWILLDYSDLIVHIFAEEERRFYNLERLWSDAATVPVAVAGKT